MTDEQYRRHIVNLTNAYLRVCDENAQLQAEIASLQADEDTDKEKIDWRNYINYAEHYYDHKERS